ncbi:DUF5632 domain-containing protein [Mycolicibacterium novocastrense]|uniref:DUF5632 domain-containing protein n=1 Tax=Mycolicibacterium novocastrense TaxID=59813 RepID=A0AAW5SRA5_MYCNV|nr:MULTISPECIES: DUF5632 domain-containing protein [Mycolicibacterium]MCV7026635.1 DUF5632 domain-containing protein [Mycolicibacterium novocastrense]MDX1887507.1 DUF5632 domain-containing protein [Mycolicibacterium sp. 120270]GAT07610.1 uncharacterized protein RMCN_0743 [Mycolicibacterium novocastrense]
MAGDLPPGKWSPALVGTWWCQSGATLRQAGQHWGTQSQEQEKYAGDLRTQWQQLAAGNSGRTADDLVSRYQSGEKLHMDLAEKYGTKRDAFNSGADALDNLRSGLSGIAAEYNQRISEIENRPGGIGAGVAKMAAISSLIAEAQGFAAHKSAAAVANIMEAVQKILTAEGISMSPQEFVKSQGISTEAPPPPDPDKVVQDMVGDGSGDPNAGGGAAGSGDPNAVGVGFGSGDPNAGGGAHTDPLVGTGSGQSGAGSGSGIGPGAGSTPIGAGGGGRVPGGVQAGGVKVDAPGAGGLSPAASVGNGLSPESLSQSFSSGAAAGQPAASGANSLTAGTMDAAVESGQPAQAPGAQPLASPVMSAPTMVGGGGGVESGAGEHASAAAAPSAAPVVSTGSGDNHAPAPAPAVVAGPAAPVAPVASGPAVPAGPLPAYGSDLRPPVVAPPAAPAVPAGPVSGAPVAPPPASSPAAGGSLVSPVERSAAAAAQSQASSSAMAGAATASATAGAAAGDASARSAEQQRLQRIVDAVARQEPSLAWAAGLREDGATTMLVTDLACGWIPPHIKLPSARVMLLEPAVRRRDTGVVDLLGSVIVASAYQPNSYIAKPSPDDPVLGGERARYGPEVDELRPNLVDAVRRRSGLPRIVQTVVLAATRKTGILDNELDQLSQVTREVQSRALAAYPEQQDLAVIGDWMLIGAIDALIEGHEEIAQYHLAWFEAVAS